MPRVKWAGSELPVDAFLAASRPERIGDASTANEDELKLAGAMVGTT